MKSGIHPNYYSDAEVICSCGNTFKTGSTKQRIFVEVCSKCHPLYTGEKRYIDTLGQVGKFQKKQEAAQKFKAENPTKTKNSDKKKNQPKSLRELLMNS